MREREREMNIKKNERDREKERREWVVGDWRALSVCATLKKKKEEKEKSGPARGMLTML